MKTTTEFLGSLPRTPITQHIGHLHAILLHLYSQTGGYSVHAIEAAERSLREIAIASLSMMDPEAAYREQMRWQYDEVPKPRSPEPLSPIMQSLAQPVPGFATAVKKAFEDMTDVLKNMKAKQTPEQREVMDIHRYKRAVEAERKKGLAFVRAEAARVRKELGLPETKTITHVRSIT